MTGGKIINDLENIRYHLISSKHKQVVDDAIVIINRQQAEIEAFAKWNKEYQDEIYELRKALLSKENLEESFSKSVKQFDKKLAKTVNLERAEAIKEFAERLQSRCNEQQGCLWSSDIGAVFNEMVGEN